MALRLWEDLPCSPSQGELPSPWLQGALALPCPLQYCHLVVKIETCGFAPESQGVLPPNHKSNSDPENAETIVTENSLASKNWETWGTDFPLTGGSDRHAVIVLQETYLAHLLFQMTYCFRCRSFRTNSPLTLCKH